MTECPVKQENVFLPNLCIFDHFRLIAEIELTNISARSIFYTSLAAGANIFFAEFCDG